MSMYYITVPTLLTHKRHTICFTRQVYIIWFFFYIYISFALCEAFIVFRLTLFWVSLHALFFKVRFLWGGNLFILIIMQFLLHTVFCLSKILINNSFSFRTPIYTVHGLLDIYYMGPIPKYSIGNVSRSRWINGINGLIYVYI